MGPACSLLLALILWILISATHCQQPLAVSEVAVCNELQLHSALSSAAVTAIRIEASFALMEKTWKSPVFVSRDVEIKGVSSSPFLSLHMNCKRCRRTWCFPLLLSTNIRSRRMILDLRHEQCCTSSVPS